MSTAIVNITVDPLGWLATRPDAATIPYEIPLCLERLRAIFLSNDHGEPFWRDENKAENGFAFENQVWSSAADCE